MSSSYFKEVLDVPQEFLQWAFTCHRLFCAQSDTNIYYLSCRDGKNFINRCTKPDKREFLRISQAVGVGFVVMGVLGYFVKLCRFGSKNNREVYGNWPGMTSVHIPVNNILVGGAWMKIAKANHFLSFMWHVVGPGWIYELSILLVASLSCDISRLKRPWRVWSLSVISFYNYTFCSRSAMPVRNSSR